MTATTQPKPTERTPTRLSFDPQAQPFVVANQLNGQALPTIDATVLIAEQLRLIFATTQGVPLTHVPEQFDESGFRYPGREGALTPASVLVPLVMRHGALNVLLTQRTAHLNDHAGQISFPGGRAESTDADVYVTALRESMEEIGLQTQYVQVLGRLPDYITGTGYCVTPVVALVQPDFTCTPDPSEVAHVFEVPLVFLMNPAHHHRHTISLPDGRQRTYYAMPFESHFIWGATAGMLRVLYHCLRQSLQPNN